MSNEIKEFMPLLMLGVGTGFLLTSGVAIAIDKTVPNEYVKPKTAVESAADNTGKNRRDAYGKTLTPLDQSNDPAHTEVTAKIRSAIVDSDRFSTYGENIKIITTADKKVTLRGPVKSNQESRDLEELAEKIAPNFKVVNELEVNEVDE